MLYVGAFEDLHPNGIDIRIDVFDRLIMGYCCPLSPTTA